VEDGGYSSVSQPHLAVYDRDGRDRDHRGVSVERSLGHGRCGARTHIANDWAGCDCVCVCVYVCVPVCICVCLCELCKSVAAEAVL
jgi:hypothetical protein